jgi:predicted lysophospholipase L1 biosynthesis ABC-type transport system permease subunit
VATTTSFPSMARALDEQGGEARLVSVKAVSTGYPLRGQLRLRDRADGPVLTVAAAPEPGTVWVEAGVLDTLQIHLGDSLLLGDQRFTITRLMVHRTRPRQRLPRLLAPGADARHRPGRHRPDPAGQPRHLPADGGRTQRQPWRRRHRRA